jgi:hypothetical protein
MSLYNKNNVQDYITRINKITADSKPLWGKMNAAQVMAHCTAPLKMAHGEIKGKRGLISFLFGKMAKKKYITKNEAFGNNLPTDPNFIFPDAKEFEEERKKLIAKLNEFAERGPKAITTMPHSFFGTMSPEEWDVIQTKHIEHHLNQFGV